MVFAKDRFITLDITSEMILTAPISWRTCLGIGLKFGLDSKIAKLTSSWLPSYELAADRWEFILIEVPKKKKEAVNLICLIVNAHMPDEISVVKIGRKEYLSLWWD